MGAKEVRVNSREYISLNPRKPGVRYFAFETLLF
jgi:hypothetical protein